jgi:hypothetical protein
MWWWAAAAGAVEPVHATRVTSPIVIDGRLDEAAWQIAPQITELLRSEPAEGGLAPGVTEVRLAYDDDALYVGVRVDDAGYAIRSNLAPREQINEDDQIGIYLDTFRDGQTAAIFYINPHGVQQDFRLTPSGISFTWDVVYETGGSIDDDGDGYTIEVRLPFRSLDFPGDGGPSEWGLYITRKVPTFGEKFTFPPRVRRDPRLMLRAAPLVLETPPGRRRIDLIPGLTLAQTAAAGPDRLEWSGLSAPLDTVHPSVELARYGVTPDTAVAATVIPDFSQIEADETPIDLNQRFAFQFDERRPFFLDGFDLLEDRASTVYTRSIVEPLYGVKLSSREGSVATGLLHSVDGQPSGTVNENPTPGFEDGDVDGRTAATTAARVRLDAFDGGYVGMILADKRVIDTVATHDTFGLDLAIPFGERWLVGASALRSVTTDGDVTLTGESSGITVTRATGKALGTQLGLADVGPGFRNETGFVTQSGTRFGWASADWTFEPGGWLDTVTPAVYAGRFTERDERGAATGEGNTLATFGVTSVAGAHELALEGSVTQTAEGTSPVAVPGYWLAAEYGGAIGGGLELYPSVGVGRVLDFDTLQPADQIEAAISALIRPISSLRLESEIEAQRLTPIGGLPLDANAVRQRVYWQLDRVHGLRIIAEQTFGAALSDRFTGSIMLTRLVHPGTAAYLGWSESLTTEGGTQTQNRAIFAKITALMRP